MAGYIKVARNQDDPGVLEVGVADCKGMYLTEKEAIDLRDKLTAVLERHRCKECGSEPCFCDDLAYDGFTRRQLKDAFDKVCNPDDWKAPIDARIFRSDVNITLAAIAFFTGTTANVIETEKLPGYVNIKSVGYRVGPAGDH